MTRQNWRVFPTTTLGKWSLGLIVLMQLLVLFGPSLANSLYRSVPAGGSILADIAARPVLAITMLVGIACGIAAFITGLVALVRSKERALMVYLSTAVGGILLFFLAGEMLFPH